MVGIIKIPLDELKQRIMEKGQMPEEELNNKIKAKMDLLAGLISPEGACHIIANELGMKVFEEASGRLQVKHILAGMRSVEIVGKVLQVFEVREFNVNGRQGKVGSFMLADETGSIRIVLWNDQTKFLQQLQDGILVKIENAYVRENSGRREVHLNDRSNLILNPEGETIKEVKEEAPSIARKNIKALTEADQQVEILGTIVQVFDPRFFEICPQCFKRIRPQNGLFVCDVHGNVQPQYSAVLNLFLDDGTDNIRAVFFRNQLANLIEKSQEELLSFRDKLQDFEAVKHDLLGKIIKVVGRVNKNEMFNRLELMANLVYPNLNPEEELKKLEASVPAETADKPFGNVDERIP